MRQCQRRRFLFVLAESGIAALSLPALGQAGRRVRRIGYLMGGTAAANVAYLRAFRERN